MVGRKAYLIGKLLEGASGSIDSPGRYQFMELLENVNRNQVRCATEERDNSWTLCHSALFVAIH